MEREKFRLRLNLFDSIVLVLALAAGIFLAWNFLGASSGGGGDTAVPARTVRYTINFTRWRAGTSSLIEEGDLLVDSVKNYELGHVVSVETVPSTTLLLDKTNRRYVLVTAPGREDVRVTVEAPCTVTDQAITVGGGYTIAVSGYTYIRGEGYMASGPIVSIEREGLE